MTKQELQEKLKMLDNEYKLKVSKINSEYAFSNNPYKVGDKFTDDIGSILIEKIQWSKTFYEEVPSCCYIGIELKKDGTPKKGMPLRKAYQSNEKIKYKEVNNEQQ
jgi:hypothetical protein